MSFCDTAGEGSKEISLDLNKLGNELIWSIRIILVAAIRSVKLRKPLLRHLYFSTLN